MAPLLDDIRVLFGRPTGIIFQSPHLTGNRVRLSIFPGTPYNYISEEDLQVEFLHFTQPEDHIVNNTHYRIIGQMNVVAFGTTVTFLVISKDTPFNHPIVTGVIGNITGQVLGLLP